MSDQPPGPTVPGRLSAVHQPHAWFAACESRELTAAPLERTIQGRPVVLFRAGAASGAGGAAVAFEDRCPHRNVPLSLGRVLPSGRLQCCYHGWEFAPDGRCVAIPGLGGDAVERRARDAAVHAVVEQDGLVWVWATPGEAPQGEPFHFRWIDDRRYGVIRRQFTVRGTLHATAENALDVPHTAFLHGGLFRTSTKRHEIEVVVRRGVDRVEAEYIGEPRPTGLAPRLLAPHGGVVTHVDRFVLPSIVQVEYRLGDDTHLVSSAALTPVDDLTTRLFAIVALRTPLPHWLVRLVAEPVMKRIFAQDARILARQTETIERFGGEQFASTPIDVLGQQIWRLLRHASGATGDAPAGEREVRLTMKV